MPVDQGSKSLSVPHSSRRKSAADTTIAKHKKGYLCSFSSKIYSCASHIPFLVSIEWIYAFSSYKAWIESLSVPH